MHASLMPRTGARPEVARDNMGHSEIGMTLNGYSQSWWDERVNAVSRAVTAVFAVLAAKPPASSEAGEKAKDENAEWVPFFGCPEGGPCARLMMSRGRPQSGPCAGRGESHTASRQRGAIDFQPVSAESSCCAKRGSPRRSAMLHGRLRNGYVAAIASFPKLGSCQPW